MRQEGFKISFKFQIYDLREQKIGPEMIIEFM